MPRMLHHAVLALACLALALYAGHAYAENETERDSIQLLRKRLGDSVRPFVLSGCAPTVPSPASLTFAAFACEGNVADSGKLIPVVQGAAGVGPLNAGNGTYWLMLHNDRTSAVGGWTRQAGTHYLWQLSATQPANPVGALLYSRVTVSAGAITFVLDLRRTHASSSKRYVTDPAFGAKCDGVTDDTTAIQAALNTLTVPSDATATTTPQPTITVPWTPTGCKFSTTLSFPNMASQFVFEGEGTYRSSQLLWYGGATPMVKLNNARQGTIRNLSLDGNVGGTVATIGIQVHQGPGLIAGPGPTQVALENLDIRDATQCIVVSSEVGQNNNNDQLFIYRGNMSCVNDGLSLEHDTGEWVTIIGTTFSSNGRAAINTVSTVFPTISANFTAFGVKMGNNARSFRMGINAVHTNEVFGLHAENEAILIDYPVTNTNGVGMSFYGGRWTGSDGTIILFPATDGRLEFYGFDLSTPAGFTVSMPTASALAKINITGGRWAATTFSYNGLLNLDNVHNTAGAPTFTNLGSGKLFISPTANAGGYDKVFTLADSATPTIPDTKWHLYQITHAAPTTITNFVGGAAGETIRIMVSGANTTFQHNAVIKLKHQVDWRAPSQAWITFIKTGTELGNTWREVAREERKTEDLFLPTTLTTLLSLGTGTVAFCADCTVTDAANNTCVGGGGGALAVRIGAVWRCFNNQN